MDPTRSVATYCFEPLIAGNHSDTYLRMVATCVALSVPAMKAATGKQPIIYTDHVGIELLPNAIDVYSDLLNNANRHLWALPKIHTYARQDEPFIHFDLDFILHKPLKLPDNIAVFYQVVEDFEIHTGTYVPDYDKHSLYTTPEFGSNLDRIAAMNMGIYICRDLDFNKYYTTTSLDMFANNISYSGNYHINCVCEQQTFALCLHASRVRHAPISTHSCYTNPLFTHFCGDAKVWGRLAYHFIKQNWSPEAETFYNAVLARRAAYKSY